VASRLRDELREKAWPSDTQLPPLRQLAEQYHASYVTMRRALLDLQEEGLVVVRQGAGIYVAGEQPQRENAGTPETTARRVALVLPPAYGEQGLDIASGLVAGFLRAAESRRWEAVPVLSLGGRCAAPAFPDELVERKIEGVAWLEPQMIHQMNLMRLQDRGIAVVGFGRRFPGMPFPTVMMDLRHLARRIVNECAADGRERLGFITPPIEEPDGDPMALDRLNGLPSVEGGSALGMQLKPHENVRTWVVALQTYMRPLVELARNGFWDDPEDVLVYDTMGYGLRQMPSDFGGLRYVRVVQPALEMGRALVAELERAWTGTTTERPVDLRPGLIRVTQFGMHPALAQRLADVS
jgi:hypothetical protein